MIARNAVKKMKAWSVKFAAALAYQWKDGTAKNAMAWDIGKSEHAQHPKER